MKTYFVRRGAFLPPYIWNVRQMLHYVMILLSVRKVISHRDCEAIELLTYIYTHLFTIITFFFLAFKALLRI